MTITNYTDLQKWFTATKGGKPAPYWNLYGLKYGRTDQVVHRNVDVSDMAESATQLENAIRMLTPPDEPARFKLSVYPEGAANNPTASVEVQIRHTANAGANAGIAGLPMNGYVSLGELEQKLENERLKWKVEQLEEQLNAPSERWERVVEHISGIPGMDKVLQTIAIGLVSKFNPSAMPAVQAAMNGTPSAQAGEQESDDSNDPNTAFLQNVQEAAATLQTDPVTMMKRLNQLIKSQPDLARQLLQQ